MKGELEACGAAMAWDWYVENIDPNKDDGKLWVPMTPQTLRTHETPRGMRSGHLMPPMMLLSQMAIYTIQPN